MFENSSKSQAETRVRSYDIRIEREMHPAALAFRVQALPYSCSVLSSTYRTYCLGVRDRTQSERSSPSRTVGCTVLL
eukprot:27702-Chlamydomonas_euryale.AAC.1